MTCNLRKHVFQQLCSSNSWERFHFQYLPNVIGHCQRNPDWCVGNNPYVIEIFFKTLEREEMKRGRKYLKITVFWTLYEPQLNYRKKQNNCVWCLIALTKENEICERCDQAKILLPSGVECLCTLETFNCNYGDLNFWLLTSSTLSNYQSFQVFFFFSYTEKIYSLIEIFFFICLFFFLRFCWNFLIC